MPKLTVAAVVAGEPGPAELWTLRGAARSGCELLVAPVDPPAVLPRGERAVLAFLRSGPLRATAVGLADLLAEREERLQGPLMDELFDAAALRSWWRGEAFERVDAQALRARRPDLVLVVSGRPPDGVTGRLGTLEVRHPAGPLGVVWAVVRGRLEWTGAAVRAVAPGPDEGPALWRQAPQLAPGDSAPDIYFRAHVHAVAALTAILRRCAEGGAPPAPIAEEWPAPPAGEPGLADWLLYLSLDRGRRCPALLARGLEC